MSLIKLNLDDKDVLRPIKIFDIAYNTWCKSHMHDVGDAQKLKEFKMQLEDCASTLEMSKLQDKDIVHWFGIFLKACEDWKAPINPQKNLRAFSSKVFEILGHFPQKVDEEKFIRILFWDPAGSNDQCVEEKRFEVCFSKNGLLVEGYPIRPLIIRDIHSA